MSANKKSQKMAPLKEEKDIRLESKLLHEEVLKAVLSHAFLREKPTVFRRDLERLVRDSVKKVSDKRKTEVIRSVINVLIALRILLVVEKETEDDEDVKVKANPEQARVLENVDHYSHALFLLREYEEKLVKEEVALVQQLIARAKTSKSSLLTKAVQIGENDLKRNVPAPPKNAKRRKTGGDEIELGAHELATGQGPSAGEVVFNPMGLPVIHTIHEKVKTENAVNRIRSLQVLLHVPGAKHVLDRVMSSHADKPKFNPVALGPIGPSEMPVGARESRGPSVGTKTSADGKTVIGSTSLANSQIADSSHARADAVNGLKPGFEMDIKTKALNFGEIAAQFEIWNGQDSEIGVSGRSSPRPSPSPGPESIGSHSNHALPHLLHPHATAPGATPTPPLPMACISNSPVLVRVPQWTKIPKEEQIPNPECDLSESEDAEEKLLDDDEMLKRHNHALEEFRVAYEREQELIKQKKKEIREAGERQARDVVAAVRARSASQHTQSNSTKMPPAPK